MRQVFSVQIKTAHRPRYRHRPCAFVHLIWSLSGRPSCCVAGGLVARFDDVAVVCQPIQQRRDHLGIAKYARSFREAEVGRDDHAFVQVARL